MYTKKKNADVPATGKGVQLAESASVTTDGLQAKKAKHRKVKRGGAAGGEDAAINKLAEEISRLQELVCKNKLTIIRHHIAIGAALSKLKAKTKHGKWKKRRDELGFDERRAQRSVKLANSELAKQIRVMDPDLAKWLPVDLQKLDILSQLSAAELQKALAAWRGGNRDDGPEATARRG